MRRLSLYSPIPPSRTGTADYFELAVARLAAMPAFYERAEIVVDTERVPGPETPASYMGIPIVDFRARPDIVADDETRIYFVANNEYHTYVHLSLERVEKLPGGRIISLLHDPSCFMLLEYSCRSLSAGFSPSQLRGLIEPEFGPATDRFIDALADRHLPDVFYFTTLAQRSVLSKSDEIWTHSLFAAAKLFCESRLDPGGFPRLRVCAHPRHEVPDPSIAANSLPEVWRTSGRMLRIGVFGWVAPSKRINNIIRGLGLAFHRLAPDWRSRIELLVVGALPAPESFDPMETVRQQQLTDRVRFLDYVPETLINGLMASCDLIFNLRFPSCGETSGMLARIDAVAGTVVTSRYQSFAEGRASRRITTLPIFEEWEIADAIVAAALDGDRQNRVARPAPEQTGVAPIEKLILRELLRPADIGSVAACRI
jgi:glycosyltransferase involved in cell wall biosynthesis